MRAIKFRAWDTFNGCFHYATMEQLLNGYNPLDMRIAVQEGQTKPPEQSTGLYDRNGQEIYEGDIIRARLSEYWGGDEIIGNVFYENGAFLVIRNVLGRPNLLYGLAPGSEVIGNIHENPELLPAKNTTQPLSDNSEKKS